MDEETSQKVWQGNYWGSAGALQKGIEESDQALLQDPEAWKAMIERSSLLYSAASNAIRVQGGDQKKPWVARLFWKAYGLCLLESSVRWMDHAWETVPIRDITPEMCDVRQSILRAAAKLPWHRHRLNEVLDLVYQGLGIATAQEAPLSHTYLLLLLGRIDVMIRQKQDSDKIAEALQKVIEMAGQAVRGLDTRLDGAQHQLAQYARVYRQLADRCQEFGWSMDILHFKGIAQRLARESGAIDQLQKLGA